MGTRVMVVAPAIAPAVGGAETLAANLCEAMLRSGDQLDLVCGSKPYPHLERGIEECGGGVFVIERGDPGDRLRWEHDTFYRAEVLYRLIRDRHPRQLWVLSHDAAISAAIALAGVSNHPQVFALYSEVATEQFPFGPARTRFSNQLDCIDTIVCLSRRYQEISLGAGADPHKIVVNPLGIDVARFSNPGRVLEPRVNSIVCPSRFSRRKGQLELVQAFAGYLLDRPAANLVLAGTANSGSTAYLDEVKQTIDDLDISERVDILTQVSNLDMDRLLAESDLVVQPSHFEGLGYSAIEAMASGTPTILTDVAGFDEFAVDGINCRLVAPQDADGLAAAMRLVDEDFAGRCRIAQGGVVTSRDRFDIDSNYRMVRSVGLEVAGTGVG